MKQLTVNKLITPNTAHCGYYLCALRPIWRVEILGSWVGPQTYCDAHLHIGCQVLAEWNESDPATCQLPSRAPRKVTPEPTCERSGPPEPGYKVIEGGRHVPIETEPMFEADVYTPQGVQGRLV